SESVVELKRWSWVLSGLSTLASPGEPETPDAAGARHFLAGWRADPQLARDVRFASAGPVAFENERTHAVVQGVGRRELAVSFVEPPAASISGNASGLEVDLKAEQRYLVPVLSTASYRATATQARIGFRELRRAI